jgi:hypothetical protein
MIIIIIRKTAAPLIAGAALSLLAGCDAAYPPMQQQYPTTTWNAPGGYYAPPARYYAAPPSPRYSYTPSREYPPAPAPPDPEPLRSVDPPDSHPVDPSCGWWRLCNFWE